MYGMRGGLEGGEIGASYLGVIMFGYCPVLTRSGVSQRTQSTDAVKCVARYRGCVLCVEREKKSEEWNAHRERSRKHVKVLTRGLISRTWCVPGLELQGADRDSVLPNLCIFFWVETQVKSSQTRHNTETSCML